MVVPGIEIGMGMQVLVLAVQNAADVGDLGVATSSVDFFRSLGGSFGVAVFGAIFAARLDDRLMALIPRGALGNAGLDPEVLTATPERLQKLPPEILAPVTQAMSESITTIFVWTVPFLVVGILIAIALPELPLKDTAHVGSPLEGAEQSVAPQARAEVAGNELAVREPAALAADGPTR